MVWIMHSIWHSCNHMDNFADSSTAVFIYHLSLNGLSGCSNKWNEMKFNWIKNKHLKKHFKATDIATIMYQKIAGNKLDDISQIDVRLHLNSLACSLSCWVYFSLTAWIDFITILTPKAAIFGLRFLPDRHDFYLCGEWENIIINHKSI